MKKTRHFIKHGVSPVLSNLTKRFFQDGVGKSAAALAYYLLFSFFPFLIFLNTLLSVLNLPPLTTDSFNRFIPADISNIVNSYLSHISEETNGNLMFFGLFFTFYFTMRAVDCLMCSIQRAYRLNEKRSFPWHQIRVFFYTIFLMLIIFISLLLLTIGRTVLTFLSRFFPIHPNSISFWNISRFFILAIMLFCALAMLYYLVPGRKYTVRQVLPGTVGALIFWLIFSIGFAFYVEHMANYSIIYGSLGAIIVLLLWLYTTSISLIMGAELNNAIYNKKKSERKMEAFLKG